MYIYVTCSDFIDAFRACRRDNHFSREGLIALFDYFEEYEESCAERVELDVIAICCDFCEWGSLEEFHKEYNKEQYPDLETIEEHTTVIRIGDSEAFITGSF